MPKICIVLATYNGEKYLAQMLDSLMEQSRPADLVIAVDDGSRDSSVQILNRYAQKLPMQITVLPQNTGHRSAFTKSLSLAAPQLDEGDFIALADQDDVWLPQKLELLEKAMNSFDMVYGDAQIIDANGNITAPSWRASEHLLEHLSVETQLTGFTNVTGCLMMFRASLLKSILPIPQNVPVHDQWITLCASVSQGYKAISEPVIQYRIHGNNAIGEAGNHTWQNKLLTNLQWSKAIRESNLYNSLNTAQRKFLNEFIIYLQKRFCKWLLPSQLPWLIRNSSKINPHVHSAFGHLTHALFGIVGVKFATHFLGKK